MGISGLHCGETPRSHPLPIHLATFAPVAMSALMGVEKRRASASSKPPAHCRRRAEKAVRAGRQALLRLARSFLQPGALPELHRGITHTGPRGLFMPVAAELDCCARAV